MDLGQAVDADEVEKLSGLPGLLAIWREGNEIEVDGGPSAPDLVRWAHQPEEDTIKLIMAAADRRPIVEL